MAADRRRQIIFYGDSNTYGYDPADPYRQMFPYDARWTTIVSKNLKDHFQVLAEGMNGRTLPVPPYEQSYLIKLFSLSEGDGIFSTMLGTNDILLTTHPDADIPIRKMEQYITFLKRHLDHSQILIIAPPLIGGGDIGDPLLEKYHKESRRMNDGFREITSQQGVKFADASEWGIEMGYDQVHFSTEGHRTFAGKMTELIRKIQTESEQLKAPATFVVDSETIMNSKDEEKETVYDYKKKLNGIIDLTEEARYQLLEMVDVMDLDGRGCVRLEEAMDCLLNAISIMKDEVENEKARW